jgi:hypothetical protein
MNKVFGRAVMEGVVFAIVAAILVETTRSFGEPFLPSIPPQFLGLVLPLTIILLEVGLFAAATYWARRPLPTYEVTIELRYKFRWWEKILLLPLVHSRGSLSISVACLLLVPLVVLMGSSTPLLPLLAASIGQIIIAFVVFYQMTASMRETVDRTVSEILNTLGMQAELMVAEATGKLGAHVRCYIMLFFPWDCQLRTRYTFKMAGDPDSGLALGMNQGVEGRAFASDRPSLQHPFDATKLGFGPEQLSRIPAYIKWKVAFPVHGPGGRPLGVLAMDGDDDLATPWIDKFEAYAAAISVAIGILLSEVPSREMYEIMNETEPVH